MIPLTMSLFYGQKLRVSMDCNNTFYL